MSQMCLNQFPGQMWVSSTNIFGFQIYFWTVKIFKSLSPWSFSEMIWQHLLWCCPCISDCNEGYQQQLFIKAPRLLQIALHCGIFTRNTKQDFDGGKDLPWYLPFLPSTVDILISMILVSAPVPLGLIWGLNWVGLGWGWDFFYLLRMTVGTDLTTYYYSDS